MLPLKPKVLHLLLAVADGPRHGYSIMQEVLERTDGQVRLWPAALYGLLRELEQLEWIVESRPASAATTSASSASPKDFPSAVHV